MTFQPTAAHNGDPTTCHCCGRHAVGLGVGSIRRGNDDPGYLCSECILILERIKEVRRMDPYELKALDGGVDAVGAYLDTIGKTELADFDETERRMLVKAAWLGSADELRRLISSNEAPF